MGKSVKEKLEEKQKREHRKYRDELLEDFNCLFENWKRHAEKSRRQWAREQKAAASKMEEIRKETKNIADNLKTIQRDTAREIQKLKRGRSLKFYGACFGASLLGSLIAVIICGLYWPTIRSLFG